MLSLNSDEYWNYDISFYLRVLNDITDLVSILYQRNFTASRNSVIKNIFFNQEVWNLGSKFSNIKYREN